MLSVEDYMLKAQKPSILVYGLRGKSYPMELMTVDRPTIQEVRNLCRNHTNGLVTFIDRFQLTIPFVDDVYKAELYYDEELVALRVFPPIYMYMGDKLDLTFSLSIYLDNDTVIM